MFQPISHCCSCLLWAEAGPESHLFHLSRSSNLERHQKAREERLWAWEACQPRCGDALRASTAAGGTPFGPSLRRCLLPLKLSGERTDWSNNSFFPSKQTLPVLFHSRFSVWHHAKCQVWMFLPQRVTQRHWVAGSNLDGPTVLIGGWSGKSATRFLKPYTEL